MQPTRPKSAKGRNRPTSRYTRSGQQHRNGSYQNLSCSAAPQSCGPSKSQEHSSDNHVDNRRRPSVSTLSKYQIPLPDIQQQHQDPSLEQVHGACRNKRLEQRQEVLDSTKRTVTADDGKRENAFQHGDVEMMSRLQIKADDEETSPPPPPSPPLLLALKLPDGTRVQQSFDPTTTTCQHVLVHAFMCRPDAVRGPLYCDLYVIDERDHKKRKITTSRASLSATLKSLHIRDQSVLFVERNDYEDE